MLPKHFWHVTVPEPSQPVWAQMAACFYVCTGGTVRKMDSYGHMRQFNRNRIVNRTVIFHDERSLVFGECQSVLVRCIWGWHSIISLVTRRVLFYLLILVLSFGCRYASLLVGGVPYSSCFCELIFLIHAILQCFLVRNDVNSVWLKLREVLPMLPCSSIDS